MPDWLSKRQSVGLIIQRSRVRASHPAFLVISKRIGNYYTLIAFVAEWLRRYVQVVVNVVGVGSSPTECSFEDAIEYWSFFRFVENNIKIFIKTAYCEVRTHADYVQ